MTPNSKGLEMINLSPVAVQICQAVYNEFLSEHNLSSYPVKITVAPNSLTILCGDFSIDHDRYEIMTSTPEADIKERLHSELEGQYKRHQSIAAAKKP
jgi:hypothetical protein